MRQQILRRPAVNYFYVFFQVPADDRHFKSGSPLPRLDMVSLLLDYHATAIGGKDFQSPWENLVSYMLDMSTIDHRYCEGVIAYDPQILHLRYLAVMKILVPGGNGQSSNAPNDKSIDSIKRFLAKTSPQRASAVMAILHSLEPDQSRLRGRKENYWLLSIVSMFCSLQQERKFLILTYSYLIFIQYLVSLADTSRQWSKHNFLPDPRQAYAHSLLIAVLKLFRWQRMVYDWFAVLTLLQNAAHYSINPDTLCYLI